MPIKYTQILIFLRLLCITWGQPAPFTHEPLTCNSLICSHGNNSPQPGPMPYLVIFNATAESGDRIEITIQGISGEFYRGFELLAVNSVGQITGTYDVEHAPHVEAIDCENGSQAAYLIGRSDQSISTFIYKIPADFTGELTFYASIVQTFAVFWEDQLVGTLTVT